MSSTDAWSEGLVPCTLIRVQPVRFEESTEHYSNCIPEPGPDELVISLGGLLKAFAMLDPTPLKDSLSSILVLTQGLHAFFTDEAMTWLVSKKCSRLLIDQVGLRYFLFTNHLLTTTYAFRALLTALLVVLEWLVSNKHLAIRTTADTNISTSLLIEYFSIRD